MNNVAFIFSTWMELYQPQRAVGGRSKQEHMSNYAGSMKMSVYNSHSKTDIGVSCCGLIHKWTSLQMQHVTNAELSCKMQTCTA